MINEDRKQEIFEELKKDISYFKKLEIEEKNDIDIATYVLEAKPSFLKFATKEIRKNKDLLSKILKYNDDHTLWYEVDESLKKDYDFVNNTMTSRVLDQLCIPLHLYRFLKPGREVFLEKCKSIAGIYKKIPEKMRTDELREYLVDLTIGNGEIFKEITPNYYTKDKVEEWLISGRIQFHHLNEQQRRDEDLLVIIAADYFSDQVCMMSEAKNLSLEPKDDDIINLIENVESSNGTVSSWGFEQEDVKELVYKFIKNSPMLRKVILKGYENYFNGDINKDLRIAKALPNHEFVALYEKEKMLEIINLNPNKSEQAIVKRKVLKF